MSFVTAVPESLAAAAQDLSNIGSAISGARAAAAASTIQVEWAGTDEFPRQSRRCSPATARNSSRSAPRCRRSTTNSCGP
ncbi:PE family protein [Mycobacterium szulgai]|nr:PE family protein [Mycobacterium szulgai]